MSSPMRPSRIAPLGDDVRSVRPPMRPISRRTFLHAGALTVLGAAVGCGKGEKRNAVRSIDQIIAGRPQGLEVVPAGTELLPEDEERLAFGLFRIQARTPIA